MPAISWVDRLGDNEAFLPLHISHSWEIRLGLSLRIYWYTTPLDIANLCKGLFCIHTGGRNDHLTYQNSRWYHCLIAAWQEHSRQCTKLSWQCAKDTDATELNPLPPLLPFSSLPQSPACHILQCTINGKDGEAAEYFQVRSTAAQSSVFIPKIRCCAMPFTLLLPRRAWCHQPWDLVLIGTVAQHSCKWS